MKYHTHLDEIQPLEAFYAQIVKTDGAITIPYINLGVSEHPLHWGKDVRYINKSLLVFVGVVTFEEKFKIEDASGLLTLYFGGVDIAKRGYREFKVVCKKAYLQLVADSKLSPQMWIPVDTPNFRPNMDEAEVKAFFGL